MGADVVLIEPPQGSKGHREAPFIEDQPVLERSFSFVYYNTSKCGKLRMQKCGDCGHIR